MLVKVTIEVPKIAAKQTYIQRMPEDKYQKEATSNDIYAMQATEDEVKDSTLEFQVLMDDTAYKDPEGKIYIDTYNWRTIGCTVIINKDPNKDLSKYIDDKITNKNFRDDPKNLIIVPETPGTGIYY